MEETVLLGGNITLEGFGGLDVPTLVVKKIVGRFVEESRAAAPGFAELRMVLVADETRYCCHAICVVDGRRHPGVGIAANLFVALDQSLKGVREGLQPSFWERP